MKRNIFIQMSRLHDVKGRIYYISSPARQENLYAVYETTDQKYWEELKNENREDFFRSGSKGVCTEARELIIALPEHFVDYEPNALLKDYTNFFKEKYGVECVSALHHNKAKTNYHIHMIFSERKLMKEPIEKIASRNMFYDETGKKVRTRREITDGNGKIKSGCNVILKGQVYEKHIFEKKNPKFKNPKFLGEVKQLYAEKMNERMGEQRYKMSVFQRGGPYLATKKVGKNNPKAKYIRENNKQRLRWNRIVSKAINEEIPAEILTAVKISEINQPITTAIKEKGTATDLIMRIIDRAVTTLNGFVSELLHRRLEDKIIVGSKEFNELLDNNRAPMKKKLEKNRER